MSIPALIALGCDWYGEWIPSKANIADIMTRPALKMPPLGDSWESLAAWARRMRGCGRDRGQVGEAGGGREATDRAVGPCGG